MSMLYIEAPNTFYGTDKSLFLAGGITGCPDWQRELVDLLKEEDIVLLNPRRANFPITDKSASEAQIKWEYDQLRRASAISFWFPKETLCPIVLFEWGAWCGTTKPLFIGVHQEYPRKQDIEIQTKLVKPELEIVYSPSDLSKQIKEWIHKSSL